MNSLLEKISLVEGVNIDADIDLSSKTTFKSRSTGTLIKVNNKNSLQKVVQIFAEEKIDYLVLGWGANTILPETSKEMLLQLDFFVDPNLFEKVQEEYTVPANFPVSKLVQAACRLGLVGFEALTGIPATVGGAVFMNAGTKLGEISELVSCLTILNSRGELRQIKTDEASFSYRKNHFTRKGDIIVDVTLKPLGIDENLEKKIIDYLSYRKRTQPLAEKTFGCIFKNPKSKKSAGLLLENLGLKGIEYENTKLSRVHANFLINKGGSSEREVKNLIGLIGQEFELQYGYPLELEVQFNHDT